MAEWIFPTNINQYRADDALKELRTIEWKQNRNSINVKKGDTVYIYISTPIKAIRWKCEVLESHKNPGTIDDGDYYVPPVELEMPYPEDCIVLKAVERYDVGHLLDYDRLKENGLKSRIPGPYLLKPSSLADYIHRVINTDNVEEILLEEVEALSDSELKKIAIMHSQKRVEHKYFEGKHYSRSIYIAEYAKRRAKGRCQLCNNEAPFIDKKGKPYLESHHIEWLSSGGEDSIRNTVALCPNCHRKMHRLGLEEDVNKLKKLSFE